MPTAQNVKSTTSNDGWETVVEPFGDTYSFETEGDTLIGTLTGSEELERPDLNDPEKTRIQTVYTIVDESGKKWSVWESFNIKKALDDLEPGTMVRIEYQGKSPTGKPGQTVKKFAVAVKR